MAYPEVVRVFATTQDPDNDCPWQARTPSSSTGSGVVIGPGEILTGAHVVANATFLQVQKPAHPDKAIARVKAVSHDCDLALLEIVEPDGFLAGIEPAAIGELPHLSDEVAVIGYPVGGEEISITEGVVSRIEVQRYSHSQRHLLAVTVDAAINAGNSGGPVFGDGKVVGIAFQKLSGADNIGEMVPPPIIRAFLDGIPAGRRPEVPALGVVTQNLENPLLRHQLGLRGDDSGVMVVKVDQGSSADGHLEPRDVILAIDGHKIANNGTIQYLRRHRTRYDVALTGRYVGDKVPLRVARGDARRDVEVELAPWQPLVRRCRYDEAPSYCVYGGLVFQTLTRDFLTTWDKWWNKAPKEFLYHYYMGVRTAERHEVVILTQILADEINVGYAHLYNEAIEAIDGVMPRDLEDFVTRLTAARGIVEIQTSSGGVVMLDTEEVRKATPRILERYRIPKDRSAGLPA
ncbi:MAG: trypsin-like peptidase domain-containing protein [Kofleriaceae bacterium]|nr:trypsin-like peptidase domain-containing protein [Myxococcales bacterium]MCB9564644.1 trypsin-like peptidase domain-containing protein [Kofleriaceae bacterium]MCB9573756.1 trypsin-like peptidase domain-containing protein [Kofleriaceae bacterium]